MQSPIDLSSNCVQVIPELGSLEYWTYNPQYATVSNRGHDVAVSTKPLLKRSQLMVAAHIHTPSYIPTCMCIYTRKHNTKLL